MALRTSETQGLPEPGQILIVIHDFSARGSDELSLSKGDRVELIERDDGFGDGWYLGCHLNNGKSGLFPEVYTRIAPRGSLLCSPNSYYYQNSSPSVKTPNINARRTAPYNRENKGEVASQCLTSVVSSRAQLTAGHQEIQTSLSNSFIPAPIETTVQSKSITAAVNTNVHREDSPVMNETLSVIDEHITDLKSPIREVNDDEEALNDSGSEYSSQADPSPSYVYSDETDDDDEEVIVFTREQVSGWTSEEVSEHLFTRGVEPQDCEVFRDQEITGDILLGMDQATVFLKAFDFGSIGRRLKIWQKIKSIQDEVRDSNISRRNTVNYISEHEEDSSRNRSRSTYSSITIPVVSDISNKHLVSPNTRLSNQNSNRNEPAHALSNSLSRNTHEQRHSDGDGSRYSASLRETYHSRHSSSNQAGASSYGHSSAILMQHSALTAYPKSHGKRGSFDRNWTMQNAVGPVQSYAGITISSPQVSTAKKSSSSIDLHGSVPIPGTEVENGLRSIVRLRDTPSLHALTQSRRSSYSEEQRPRNSSEKKEHSRFGSVDSIRDRPPQKPIGKYYGLGSAILQRHTPSESSVSESSRTHIPPELSSSISLTTPKIGTEPLRSLDNRPDKNDVRSPMKTVSHGRFGLRAISNAVTGLEKSRTMHNHQPESAINSQSKISPLQSPTRTGSSTPSGGLSFDLESPGRKGSTFFSNANGNSRAKKKPKKETSAYTRGLEKKRPQEAIVTADYSGWMKKKSTNLMASWKSRLFILKGRRLSYYYSENDEGERGLIDISFHRVLPADNDRLTGLHATITGATHTSKPSGLDATNFSSQNTESDLLYDKGKDTMFIFKLVPPKAGLQRAVTFTKPTIHYFAVSNVKQGRLWMAALMKATIERDESVLLKSTYQQKTISLTKARAMRYRPPALMNLNERNEDDVEALKTLKNDENSLDISGTVYKTESQEGDSGVSGL